jgi:hypothetical protein
MGGLGRELARYREKRNASRKTAAIKAKCSDCMANYKDGREDCEIPDCLLYPYMAYTAENQAKIGLNSRKR